MKMKGFLRNLFFITLPSILVFFIFLEVSLRVGGYIYTRNRNPETYAKANLSKQDTFNILCLGDSFTQGAGAGQGNSYPKQLEELLRENINVNINVYNRARGGYNSSLILLGLQKDIDECQPNLIILMAGGNNHWNWERSSYFLLKCGSLNFYQRLIRTISSFRVYKLIKIALVNLKPKPKEYNRLTFVHQEYIRSVLLPKMGIESQRLTGEGELLVGEGNLELAREKFKEALIANKNNYIALLRLAGLAIIFNERSLSKELTWQAIEMIDESDWDYVIFRVLNNFNRLGIEGSTEPIKLKSYLQNKYGKNKGVIKIINASILAREDERIFKEILCYDLREIAKLAKENGISLVLQTYPHHWRSVNDIIREFAQSYRILLVDNEVIFKEKQNYNSLFAPDGHCNKFGYRVIAENIYHALVNNNIIIQR